MHGARSGVTILPGEARAGKTLGQWFPALPVVILLCSHIIFYVVQSGYGRFIGLGEFLWEDYYLLRAAAPAPRCSDTGIDEQLQAYLGGLNDQDEFGDLFDESPDEDALRISLQQQHSLCLDRLEETTALRGKQTVALEAFRAVDHLLLALADFGRNRQRDIFALVLFICAATASVRRSHIALRPARTVQDYRMAALGELLAHMGLCYSAYHYLVNGQLFPQGIDSLQLRWLYIGGFSILLLIALGQCLIRHPSSRRGSPLQAILCVPIYAHMAVLASLYHVLVRANPQGVMLYIDKIMDFSDIFTNVALYIWTGMMLKQSRLADHFFAVVKPWRLSPEALAALVIVVMAVPTAYTGASGVLVIAMGGIIYSELRLSGARRQLAAAATAIAGSSGVVLRPCLLVVMIATLNREVTTDQMFQWGACILVLTAGVFFLIARRGREDIEAMSSPKFALKPSAFAVLNLLPYVGIFAVVIGIFQLIAGIRLDEFSAPAILPVAALVILCYEKTLAGAIPRLVPAASTTHRPVPAWFGTAMECKSGSAGQRQRDAETFERAIRTSASDGIVHIGALLMLMALSLATGGVIGDSGLFHDIASGDINLELPLAIGLLLVLLVLIGMFMDPFGAVMLVSQTLAPVAYRLGIEPLHFWMMTLVAFELGYLSPPVAVNHLFTRRVVGEWEFQKIQEAGAGKSFWFRHERILLPMLSLGIVLLLVAYAPLLYRQLAGG